MLPVHRRPLKVAREYSGDPPAGFERSVHGRSIDPARPAGHHGSARSGGEGRDPVRVPDQWLIRVARAHDGQRSAVHDPDLSAAVEEDRRIPPEPFLELPGIGAVGAADYPDRPCAPVIDGVAQQESPAEQGREAGLVDHGAALVHQGIRTRLQQIGRLRLNGMQTSGESPVLPGGEQRRHPARVRRRSGARSAAGSPGCSERALRS